MENIRLEGTSKTPKVTFDYQSGKLELTGRSIPENSLQFFSPLIEWLDKYTKEPREKTVLIINMDYFNTSSSLFVFNIVKKLEVIYEDGKEVEVKWYYDPEDDQMMQTGNHLKQILKMPIDMIETDHEEV